MNNKILLTSVVLASLASTTMAAGLDNTVDSTAAHYGAEAYGYTNTITATGRSAFVAGYKNTVSANNALVYGIKNKAEGINSLVGGEYSKATGRNSVAIGSSAQALQDNTFAIGSQARANGTDALAFGNGAYAENTATVAIGKTVKATGEGALAIGFNSEATARNSIAIGGNVKKPGDSINPPKIVASGTSSIAVGYGATAKGNLGISIGENAYSEGSSSAAIGSWSIASGDHATAVGGYARADRAVAVGSGNADGVESVSMGYYSRVSAEGSVGIGRRVTIDDNATNSVVIGSASSGVINDKKNVVAIGADTYSAVENSVALGNYARADEVVSTSSANIAGKTYNFAGSTADGTVSIGGKIISGYETDRYGMPIFDDNGNMIPIVDKTAYRTITNVAAGRISDTSTDAINGSQLHAAVKAIEKNHQAAADAMVEAKKHTSVVAGDNVAVTTGTNTANGKEYTISVNKNLTNMNSVNFGANTDSKHSIANKDGMHVFNGEVNTNYDSNGIKIENTNTLETAQYTMNGMQASDDNATIRFTTTNIDAGNQQIHGVKAGTANTDAVNVSQLKEVGNKVNDNSKRIDTNENRINDLDNKINDVSRNALERANHYTDLQVNKGVAKASALAGLKFLDYNPKDKWSFAASVGHYHNANAVAVGAAYQPNENTMIHGGITLDGKVAYNLGVSFKTGGQKQITRHELEEQIRQLENNNIRMQEELNEIRAMLEKK